MSTWSFTDFAISLIRIAVNNVPQKSYKSVFIKQQVWQTSWTHSHMIQHQPMLQIENMCGEHVRLTHLENIVFWDTICTMITYITLSHCSSCLLIIIETTKHEFDGCLHITIGKLQCLNVHRIVLKTHLVHLRQLPLQIANRRRK